MSLKFLMNLNFEKIFAKDVIQTRMHFKALFLLSLTEKATLQKK